MREDKKGVSPLIATILLVAIVVVIAFLIFWWYGEFIQNELDKSDATAEQVCMQDVSFGLSEGNCTAGTVAEERIISFTVDNTGDVRIGSFRALVEGDTSISQEIAQGVEQGVSTKLSVLVNRDELGNLLDVELIPMISAGGTTKHCTDQSQLITITCT